jgi:quercetin dioxygenase-like cupin family protein
MSEPDLTLTCADLAPALELMQSLGMRLESIYPADEPHTAVLSRGEARVRLTSAPEAPPPGGLPAFDPAFLLVRAGDGEAAAGRAGMLYRDLIPGRLGGRYVGSHISIPEGGPVADWVHWHRICFQLIVVRAGWVRVVYEDQGEPFVMRPGDMVLQPPEIRHRVLESSPGLEVVEIGCPALHETLADWGMTLPNRLDPQRRFGPQRFLRHGAAETPWVAGEGFEVRSAGLAEATADLADAFAFRLTAPRFEAEGHDRELVFGFVVAGTATLELDGAHALAPGDAFVVPPYRPWALADASADFELLRVNCGWAADPKAPLRASRDAG